LSNIRFDIYSIGDHRNFKKYYKAMVFAVFIQTPPINEFEISLLSGSIESFEVIKMRILEADPRQFICCYYRQQ